MITLPDAQKLQKLPIRAIAAYSARSARRASTLLRGLIDDEVIDAPLRIADKLATARHVNKSDAAAAVLTVAAVAEAMAGLSTHSLRRAALCLTRTAMATYSLIEAISNPPNSEEAKKDVAFAASEAARCAKHAADALGGEAASTAAIDAAHTDYLILLKKCGEHRDVVLGDPIELDGEWWRAL